MIKALLFVATLFVSISVMSQSLKSSAQSHEGFNVSFGVSSNTTLPTPLSPISQRTMVGVAKLNYTLGLPFPGKLGLSASFDLTDSKINSTKSLTIKKPSEITIEPVFLAIDKAIVYGKLGLYYSRYDTPTSSVSKTGDAYGIGYKNYLLDQNFIQLELTQRTTERNFLGTTKFKQNVGSVSIGYSF